MEQCAPRNYFRYAKAVVMRFVLPLFFYKSCVGVASTISNTLFLPGLNENLLALPSQLMLICQIVARFRIFISNLESLICVWQICVSAAV